MTADVIKLPAYPMWICLGCGVKHGKLDTTTPLDLQWPDLSNPACKCGWCGSRRDVLADPKAYGRPKMPKGRARG